MSIYVYRMKNVIKNYIELILAAILVILFIEIPEFLDEMANSNLGKMLLLSSVAFMLCYFGKNAGILAALIVVIIFYKTKEGFEGFSITGSDGKNIISVGEAKPKDDASCKKKYGDEKPKWDPKAGEDKKGACVAKSGFKLREGAEVDPCNAATDNSTCDACSKGKKPFFKDGKCSATDGFTTQEVDRLKKIAAREGFAGYNGRQRFLKPYYSALNITDEDRKVKVKAEKAKLEASKEDPKKAKKKGKKKEKKENK